jgi:hypothetical protein
MGLSEVHRAVDALGLERQKESSEEIPWLIIEFDPMRVGRAVKRREKYECCDKGNHDNSRRPSYHSGHTLPFLCDCVISPARAILFQSRLSF